MQKYKLLWLRYLTLSIERHKLVDDDDDEIAYFSVRWKTRNLV